MRVVYINLVRLYNFRSAQMAHTIGKDIEEWIIASVWTQLALLFSERHWSLKVHFAFENGAITVEFQSVNATSSSIISKWSVRLISTERIPLITKIVIPTEI